MATPDTPAHANSHATQKYMAPIHRMFAMKKVMKLHSGPHCRRHNFNRQCIISRPVLQLNLLMMISTSVCILHAELASSKSMILLFHETSIQVMRLQKLTCNPQQLKYAFPQMRVCVSHEYNGYHGSTSQTHISVVCMRNNRQASATLDHDETQAQANHAFLQPSSGSFNLNSTGRKLRRLTFDYLSVTKPNYQLLT